MPRKQLTLRYRGEELTLTEWSKRLRCSRQTLVNRLKAGWPTSTIITTPIARRRVNTRARLHA